MGKRTILVGLLASSLAIAITGPAMADDGTLAHAKVAHIDVTGQETPIYGIDQGLPPLNTSEMYFAGPGFIPQISAYHDSGDYQAGQAAVARAAQRYLTSYLREHCQVSGRCTDGRKAAAVFDIDDTLLSSYDAYVQAQFSPSEQQIQSLQVNCQQTLIPPTKALLDAARARKVRIFLITGRQESLRAATKACLARYGISGWQELIMRKPDQQSLTALQYKSAARARIERQGYLIVTAIGDQISDSAGGHAERGFLLPNPMYFIP